LRRSRNAVQPSAAEKELLGFLLDGPYQKLSDYHALKQAPHLDVGLDDPEFRNFAGIYSDAMFNIFYQFAKTNLKKKQPFSDARVRSEL